MRSPSTRTLALTLASVAAVAALGGAASAQASAPLSDEPVTLSLVGFAVPKAGNDAAQAAVRRDPGRRQRHLGDLLRRVGRPEPRRGRRPRRPTTSTSRSSRDVTRLVDAGLVAAGLERRPQQGHRHRLGRRARRARGQPEGHHRLGRPRSSDDVSIVTPNPGSSGSARWNILAAYGSVIADGGTEEEATDYLDQVLQQRRHAARQRPRRDDRLPRRDRRRADLLRERGDPRPPAGRGLRLHRPRHDAAHREPGRRHDRRRPPAPRRTSTSCSAHEGQTEFASEGLPPDRRHRRSPTSRAPTTRPIRSRRRRRCSRSTTTSAAGARRTRSSSHEDTGIVTQAQQIRQVVTAGAVDAGEQRQRRCRLSTRRRASGSAWRCCGSACSCSSRCAPSSSRRRAAGWSEFWDTITNPQTFAAAPAHRSPRRSLVTVLNVVMGTLIAWVLVRDHFSGKRALEVLIDIPFALPTIVAGLVLLSLYGPQSPLRPRRRQHPPGDLPRLRLRHPAVRRAHRAAGARRARPRGRGGRGVARRRLASRCSGASSCPRLLPAIAAGAALSFARAISEYGSLVLLSGNLPMQTEVTSVRMLSYIENGNMAVGGGRGDDPAGRRSLVIVARRRQRRVRRG